MSTAVPAIPLIDLGEVGAEPAPGPPGVSVPPGRSWPARRRWGVAVVLLLVLALPTASGVPDPAGHPALVGVLSADQSDTEFGLDGNLLYVSHGFPGEPPTLRIYRLGARLTPAAPAVTGALLTRSADTLVLMTGWCPDNPEGLTGIDARTGVVRWRHPGRPLTVAGSLVLLARPTGPACVDQPVGRAATADAVEIATGRVAWTATTVDNVHARPSTRDRPVIYLADDAGRLVRRDARTGTALGPKPVAVPVPPGRGSAATAPAGGTELIILPDALLVVTFLGPDVALATLDPVSLRTLWSDRWTGEIGVAVCGALVCVNGPDGTTARSARDGRVAWRTSWTAEGLDGWRWAVGFSAARGIGPGTPVVLLDVRTGRAVARLDGWRVAWPRSFPWLGTTEASDSAGDVLLYRDDGGRTVLGRLERTTGGFAPRASARIPAPLAGCAIAGRYLACRAPGTPAATVPDGAIQVRRLPPGI